MRGQPEDDDQDFWPFGTETAADPGPGWRDSPPAGATPPAQLPRPPAGLTSRPAGQTVLPTRLRRPSVTASRGAGRPNPPPASRLDRLRPSAGRRPDRSPGPGGRAGRFRSSERQSSERRGRRLSVVDAGLLALAVVVLVLVAVALT